MEKYSVLMTVYKDDNPEYFSVALDSMVKQTYPADEIVLVKDGPIGEELQKVIDEQIKKGAPIVQVQLPNNVGLGEALNEGIRVVKNELIVRMDSDDYSLPTRCEKQIRQFEEKKELDIVGCPVKEFIGSIGNVVGERKVPLTNQEIYQFAKTRDPFNHPAVVYRKSFLEKVGGYSNYRKNQDTDLWVKMLTNQAVGMNLPEALLYFRFDENTYAKRKSWLNTKTLIQIRHKAWKLGFNTFGEFLGVMVLQVGLFILPAGFQRLIYKRVLRR